MKPLQKKLSQFTLPQQIKSQGIYPFYHPIQTGQDTEVMIHGQKVLMFGSNSYLGLTNHPELVEAAQKAIQKYGTGASGSRLMNGNLDLHEELESALGKFVNKPAAAVFSTGFQANIGAISSLLGRNDYLIIDEKDHASIIEGCRLSFAKTLKYKHNNMESLESVLQKTDPNQLKLIVTDGVFSMEGDVANLSIICQLAEQYNASVMVDDAHGLGVMGPLGAGTVSHFNLTDKTDIIMGTFSKSLASLGGFIASDSDTINYLKHNARSLLFSASIPPALAATALKALEIIKREPERIDQLWSNTHYAHLCLLQENFSIGNSTTPIIPIFVGDEIETYTLSAHLLRNGLYINPAVHPAVEKGQAILRLSLMATHTRLQIDQAVDTLVQSRFSIRNNTIAERIFNENN
ncbi:MAG: pyridoxal phosphate-dependent aminotransferase family protein [Bacteroidales bacterium]|jgi:8-amino-7-oxononanoate synthase